MKNERDEHLRESAPATQLPWQKVEFDRGYEAGYELRAYSPTSMPYIEGYESGELAALRAGKRRKI